MIHVSCNAWERVVWVSRPLFILLENKMNKLGIEEKLKDIAGRVAETNGLELVHVDTVGTIKKLTVRIFIDKPGGVTLEDCARVSRETGEILDNEDFIPAAYLLEVSSPGLERELYSLGDFKKFAGSRAKVRTHSPIEGQRNFRGRIVRVEGEEIVFQDLTSGEVKFPYSGVAKANLEIDLDEELKRSR